MVARVLDVAVASVRLAPPPLKIVHGLADVASAAWLARGKDVATRIAALETDAKITLAGPQAQHQFRPLTSRKMLHAWGERGD